MDNFVDFKSYTKPSADEVASKYWQIFFYYLFDTGYTYQDLKATSRMYSGGGAEKNMVVMERVVQSANQMGATLKSTDAHFACILDIQIIEKFHNAIYNDLMKFNVQRLQSVRHLEDLAKILPRSC